MEVDTSISHPISLDDLIKEVRLDISNTPVDIEENSDKSFNSLMKIIKKYKFFPSLQVKKFFSNDSLILLHNTYKRYDVSSFQQLYDECRSVVLDLNAQDGKNVVVTFAQSIPDRMNIEEFSKVADTISYSETSFEGTVITVYKYNDEWYYGTTSCPTVNSSRYFHPTKTHGVMFDEAIAKITGDDIPTNRDESNALRTKFSDTYLDSSKAYAFVLVHYENRHIIDYTDTLGENYTKLVHIVTRNRDSFQDESLSNMPLAHIGIIYPTPFVMPQHAIDYLNTAPNAYAILSKTTEGKLIKVSKQEIISREEKDLGNPNIWHNMLHVYMQNKPIYKINDYLKEFNLTVTNPTSSRGFELDPTYIIHTVICNMRDVLYNLFKSTLKFYNVETKRYVINRDADNALAPIIRFHLIQLRNIQVSTHIHAPLNPKVVYHYICHHQTMKNIRLLIHYFATSWIDGNNLNGIKPMAAESFKLLDKLLSQR
jgi:hypothetical protein